MGRDGAGHWRGAAFVAALLASPLTAPGRAEEAAPLAPPALVDRIGRTALDLAKRSRSAEAGEVVGVLTELRAPAASVAALRERIVKAAATAKPAPLPMADLAKTAAKLATDLAALLPALDGEPKLVVARQVLVLDGAQRGANAALGRVEAGGAWIPSRLVPALGRRAAIQNAILAAQKADVPVTVGAASHPLLAKVFAKPGVSVRSGKVSIESVAWGAERMARQLRESVRAMVLCNWLLSGRMDLARRERGLTTLVVDARDDYLRLLDAATAQGIFDAEGAKLRRPLNSAVAGDLRLQNAVGESRIGSMATSDALIDSTVGDIDLGNLPVAFRAGLTNWLCAKYLGAPPLTFSWIERPDGKSGGGRTSDTPQQQAEREAMLRISKAGFSGLRLWMKWLASRHEDPAWSHSMVDQVGKVSGNDLVKSTFVVDYLLETGELGDVLRRCAGGPQIPATYEKGLGRGLASFEVEWREWLLAGDPPSGLAQRLGAPAVEPMSATEAAALAHLDAVRRRTLGKDSPGVGLDRELSDGCLAHARYLALHPEQCAAWPDAHEEYADREGFSAAGGRAGQSSVIAPGSDGPESAIDGWMGTFYHRLPLLAPGLVRIGWGFEKRIAVLDAGSLVAPPDALRCVSWPPAGATGVPRRFRAELPHPVPGEDQSAWGHPVTLQVFSCLTDPDVRMRLFAGPDRGGVEVACHFSTPNAPTNPQLAPAGAFCLIPRQTLAANTTYTVAVDGWPKGWTGADWQFTTGAK